MLCLLLSCLVDSLLSPEIDVIVVVLQVGSRAACKLRGSRTKRRTARHAWQPGRGMVLARAWPVLALGCAHCRLGLARSSTRVWPSASLGAAGLQAAVQAWTELDTSRSSRIRR